MFLTSHEEGTGINSIKNGNKNKRRGKGEKKKAEGGGWIYGNELQ